MQNLVSTLTEREKEVFDLLVTGAKNQDMADELCVALQTIKYHMANIFQKLGVKNRGEAIAYGLGDREISSPALTDGSAFTEKQIRQAAMVLVEKKLGSKRDVNEMVINLLAALGGKL